MTVPVVLRAVDGQVDVDAVLFAPFVEDLLEIDQIFLRARTVDDVDLAVAVAVMTAVVDDGMQGRKADAAGDEQQILASKCGVHGEAVSIGAAQRELLPRLHAVQPRGHAAALFDGEFQKAFLRRGGGDGKQCLAHTGHGEHRALAGDVRKGLFAVQVDHAEGLDIGRVHADVRDLNEHGNQRIVSHLASPPSVRMTLTLFM